MTYVPINVSCESGLFYRWSDYVELLPRHLRDPVNITATFGHSLEDCCLECTVVHSTFEDFGDDAVDGSLIYLLARNTSANYNF